MSLILTKNIPGGLVHLFKHLIFSLVDEMDLPQYFFPVSSLFFHFCSTLLLKKCPQAKDKGNFNNILIWTVLDELYKQKAYMVRDL